MRLAIYALCIASMVAMVRPLQACTGCTCPNAEVQEIKQCSSKSCTGTYSQTGYDTINPQNNCSKCVVTSTFQCCGHTIDNYDNDETKPCHPIQAPRASNACHKGASDAAPCKAEDAPIAHTSHTGH
jgi:hypothetical protein